MHILKLEVEDSVIDKVKMLLKQLPQNEVRIKEDSKEQIDDDFISYLTSHPIDISSDETFFSRTQLKHLS